MSVAGHCEAVVALVEQRSEHKLLVEFHRLWHDCQVVQSWYKPRHVQVVTKTASFMSVYRSMMAMQKLNMSAHPGSIVFWSGASIELL